MLPPAFRGELPDGVADRITTSVVVTLDWRDRLRVLWHGRLIVDIRTNCEHAPGFVESATTLLVPPVVRRHHGFGDVLDGGEGEVDHA